MRRRIARPYGQSTSAMRLASMFMALVVLWALYYRLKDPATWRMFVEEKKGQASTQAEPLMEPVTEELVPGPNDLDEAEVAAMQPLFEMVTDRAPLKPREMDAYWRLLDWSRAEPFDQLKQRARNDVPFTQLWEQPEKYRGNPIQLRLHVQRVLEYDDAAKSPSGITKVYEAWGWTDECRPFWYCVVFPELPQGMPIGTDVRVDLEFVGYFLKVMSYTAKDHSRGAPLLLGRARMVATPAVAATTASEVWSILLFAVGGIAIVGFAVWKGIRPQPKTNLSMLPTELSSLTPEAEALKENPFSHLDN